MSNVILYRTNKLSFENWNLCSNRKRCTTRAWPLAPGTIIFQRSFTVCECTVMTALFSVACHRHLQNRSLSQMTWVPWHASWSFTMRKATRASS